MMRSSITITFALWVKQEKGKENGKERKNKKKFIERAISLRNEVGKKVLYYAPSYKKKAIRKINAGIYC